MKRLARPLTTRGIDPSRAELRESVTRHLGVALREDLERLTTIVGPGFDAWGLLDGRKAGRVREPS